MGDAADQVARQMEAMRLNNDRQEVEDLRIEIPAVAGGGARGYGGAEAPHMAYWGGPFAAPIPANYAAPASVDDVAMPTRSPVAGGVQPRVATTTPVLPTAPKYDGESMHDRRVFMQRYETYVHSLTAFNTIDSQPFQMPVSACIEDKTRRVICMFEFRKHPALVTEQEWVDYFRKALEPEKFDDDYTLVNRAMLKLKMSTVYPDAASRMSKLQKDLYKILEDTHMDTIIPEREPQKLVEYLTAAFEPAEFREMVVERMRNKTNKPLKTDVVRFCKWATDILVDYVQWTAKLRPEKAAPRRDDRSRQPPNGRDRERAPRPTGGSGPPTGGGSVPKTPREEDKNRGAGGKTGGGGCLKCGATDHLVRECSKATEAESRALVAQWRAARKAENEAKMRSLRLAVDSDARVMALQAPAATTVDLGTAEAELDGVVVRDALLDTGADVSLVAVGVLRELERGGAYVCTATAGTPMMLSPVGGKQVAVTRKARFREVRLRTSAGPLVLHDLECWVHETDESLALTIGRPVMVALGYSTDGLLAAAKKQLGVNSQDETDKDGAVAPDGETTGGLEGDAGGVTATPLIRMQQLRSDQLRAQLDAGWGPEDDGLDLKASLPDLRKVSAVEDVKAALDERFDAALQHGMSRAAADRLRALLDEYTDVFRLEFGQDPPVSVEPLRVRLKPDAVPVKCKQRRYPPVHREFLEQHVQELQDAGLVFENHRSRWASPPRIVAKKEPGQYRMTVDTRGVNAMTEPMPWPMPDLESAPACVEGSTAYFAIDWFRGYWQLPLHPDSQELYTIMTARGMVTPTRVLMGSTDAVAYCQGVVETIFGDMLYSRLLAWLDDVLGFAADDVALMGTLETVLQRCAEYGLKLHPKKCEFYVPKAKWCGKIISKDGVAHCPERVAGLVDMQPPTTGADLQQLLCAVNWMRGSIPMYSTVTANLYELLEAAAKAAGSRKKTKLQRVPLSSVGWSAEHESSLASVKAALLEMVPLAHPRADTKVCLFTDASLDHWGAVATQVPLDDIGKDLADQQHEPLAFLSGKFVGAASRWPIVEKEAFAIVEACKRLEYVLLRPGGFKIYTDHRNLTYIFSPHTVNANMARYQADKLQRWAMALTMFEFEIEHVAGDDNVWGDLLSRWGAAGRQPPQECRMQSLAIVKRVSPLQEPEFQWPSEQEIATEQRNELASRPANGPLPDCVWDSERAVYVVASGAIWVPASATDLQQRICVVAHAGASGHRGERATLQAVQSVFSWDAMATDVRAFVQGCFHCLAVGSSREPRL